MSKIFGYRCSFAVIMPLIFAFLLTSFNNINADDTMAAKELKASVIQKLKNMSGEEMRDYHQHRTYREPDEEFLDVLYDYEIPYDIKYDKKPKLNTDDTPETAWFPAEYDEMQAVLISWPHFAYDVEGDLVYPMLPGIATKEDPLTHDEIIVEIKGYVIELFDDSDFSVLWAKLAAAIMQECQVWIRLVDINDSTAVKNFIAANYSTAENYRFIPCPEGTNEFWMRDFGPHFYYYGDQDSLGIMNAEYYPVRPIDNSFPELLAEQLDVKLTNTDIEMEGGNFMSDGFGNGFYSNVVKYANQDNMGTVYMNGDYIRFRSKTPKTPSDTYQELAESFNLKSNTVLQHLDCDGGTGHIDMYLKLLDDETILMTEYPDVYDNQYFDDYEQVEANLAQLQALSSEYDKPYVFKRIPMPTSDNGNYTLIDCDNYSYDPRGFVNGLIVNKSFIFPSFSNEESGNKAGDEEAVNLLKQYLPGYNIVPIDARLLTPFGGAIHCITMQVPAENPIKIWHPTVSGYHAWGQDIAISATAENRSGIESISYKWRKKNEQQWTELTLDKESELYQTIINTTDFDKKDTIQYYIEVQSNNGKTMTKPITAPDGYYTFHFQKPSSVRGSSAISKLSINPPRPNPVATHSVISYYLPECGEVTITIYNIYGQLQWQSSKPSQPEGRYSLSLDRLELVPGFYGCRIESAGQVAETKFVVAK